MRKLSVRAALVLGLLAALVPITSASASTTNGDGTAAFRAEAMSAGLTSLQAQELQKRVDGYLAESGGKQVAANKIEYETGGNLLLTLPGEKVAHELGEPESSLVVCIKGWFCAWRYENYTGDKRSEFFCNKWITIPWAGWGSWQNNQTKGTIAIFLDSAGNPIGNSGRAPLALPHYIWTPVWYIDIC